MVAQTTENRYYSLHMQRIKRDLETPVARAPDCDHGRDHGRDRFIGRWVARIYRATHCFMADGLRDVQVGYGQFPFLLYLEKTDGACQEKISRDLYYDKGTTARALQKLEKSGLIRREICAADRRKLLAFISPGGRAVLRRIEDLLKQWQGILATGLSPDEADFIRMGLIKCTANAREYLAGHRSGKCCPGVEKPAKEKSR
jgi:DNA-binding MarR family transcriptional regulator